MLTRYLLNGKTINLTSDDIAISANNFNVDKNGNMTCKNAKIIGGNLNLGDAGQNSSLVKLYDKSNENTYSILTSWGPSIYFKGIKSVYPTQIEKLGDSSYGGVAYHFEDTDNNKTVVDPTQIKSPDIYSTGKLNANSGLVLNGGTIKADSIYSSNTVTNAPNMYITSSGNFRRTTNTSSKRYKKEIKKVTDESLNPQKLYDLQIKQFKYKEKYQPDKSDERYNKNLIGFIAEDIEKVFPIAIDYETDKDGNKIIDNWNERYIIPAMLKLIQEQNERIKKLESKEVTDGNN